MDRVLLYEDNTGYLRIIVPNEKYQQPQESEAEALSRVAAGHLPDVTTLIVCRPNAVPSDRCFRDAWYLGDQNEPIKIDFSKAIFIHRNRLKQACDRKIDQLTKMMALAFERSNLPEAVAIGRTTQILRYLHEMDLSHCKGPQDIKYSIPRELFDVWDFYDPNRILGEN